jgi:hypothetical protein
MIVRVQNEIYDEMSVLWTSGENKGVMKIRSDEKV